MRSLHVWAIIESTTLPPPAPITLKHDEIFINVQLDSSLTNFRFNIMTFQMFLFLSSLYILYIL